MSPITPWIIALLGGAVFVGILQYRGYFHSEPYVYPVRIVK